MKKQASFNLDQESRELLLFDYLEGNLTAEMAAQLEEAMATDPDLCAALDSWKESYVVQDFYATHKLEEQLLAIPPKSFSLSGPLVGFSLVLITALLSFLAVGEQSEKHILPAEVVTPIGLGEKEPEVLESAVETTKAQSEEALLPGAAVKSDESVEAVLAIETLTPPRGELKYELPAMQALMPVADPVTFDADGVQFIVPKLVHHQLVVQPKEISRKQQRQIRRMKARALQQRKANEFMKGNRPYVVPLNTKNF